jgi:iron(III) transport system substrate-binding protein
MSERSSAARRLTRRGFLKGTLLTGAASWLAACAPSRPDAAAPSASSSAPASSGGAPAAPDWEQRWNSLVEAARQEGRLVMGAPPTPATRTELARAFKNRFDVEIEYLGVSSGPLTTRIEAERAAGHYTVDIMMGGAGDMYDRGFEAKLFEPVRSALIHPEVTDTSKWVSGRIWFMDPEQQYILRVSNQVTLFVVVNTQHVNPSEIATWNDLLDPRFRGRIALSDPNVAGPGANAVAYLLSVVGEDYVRRLYQDQRPALERDYRQLSDWLARGTYPIVSGIRSSDVESLRRDGFPVAVVLGERTEVPPAVSAGGGLATMLNGAPHPNAARLFMNWIVMREGQEVWNRSQVWVSVRTDVDNSWAPDYTIPKPGVQYFDTYDWDFTLRSRSPEQLERIKRITVGGA